MLFIRSAQALDFSLAQIVEILPRLAAGNFGRREIEQQLSAKLAEIDAHIEKLRIVKTHLLNTFDAVDPFAPDLQAGQCGSLATLWTEATAARPTYRRRVLLNAGFSDRPQSMEEIENLEPDGIKLLPDSPALMMFVRMIGLKPATRPRSSCARPTARFSLKGN